MRCLALAVALAVPSACLADEVQRLSGEVAAAYRALDGLTLRGSNVMDVRYGGMTMADEQAFESVAGGGGAAAGGDFRHEQAGVGKLIVRDDGQTVIYDKVANRFERFGEASAVEDAANPDAALADDEPHLQVLRREDPSLLLAINGGDVAALTLGAAATVDAEASYGGVATDSLTFTRDNAQVTLHFADDTRLLLAREIDATKKLEADGVTDVESARFATTYDASEAGAVDEQAFVFVPPRDALDVNAERAEQVTPALALEQKAAPAFDLPALGGDFVALADLKGQVVVLDFWASWCGPCRDGLPGLAALAAEQEDVTVYAINVNEDEAVVRGFLDEMDLTLPVLLDDGAVAGDYLVQGIPQTVVIDAAGVVRKVIVGYGPGTDEELRAAVEAAKVGDADGQ